MPNINLMTKDQFFDSFKIAIVVGSVLSIINQFDSIMYWDFTHTDVLRIFLNYLVPFCVASISRAMHIKKVERRKS